MKIRIFALCALAAVLGVRLNAQTTPDPKKNNRFYVYYDASGLSAADATLTLQQPSSGSRWVFLEHLQVYCSVACVLTISRDGTAATATAATEVSLNGGETATATAFTASDVGSGTTINTLSISAGSTVAIDLERLNLEPNNSTANNITFDTDDITGDVTMYLRWREE